MLSVDLANRYLRTGGGVPQRVIDLHAAEASLGDKFEYKENLDAVIIRGFLGLNGGNRTNLPPHEVGRLAEMLLRFGQITDEELILLGLKKIKYE